MSDGGNRRPLKVRGTGSAQRTAAMLSRRDITPNQISVASVFFALGCAVCLFLLPELPGYFKFFIPILAAALIQCRLLCNLFDGMVAVEGGKTTASGELYNDIPDRVADPFILIAAGYAATAVAPDLAVIAGWLAGILAVFTAYIRTLCTSMGCPTNFRGPMAKQHRMAVMTFACVLSAFEWLIFSTTGYILFIALVIIILGCLLTIWRRIKFAYDYLEKK